MGKILVYGKVLKNYEYNFVYFYFLFMFFKVNSFIFENVLKGILLFVNGIF